ncbi:hypothetical protein, partial [Enterobacter intestinihominis]
METITTPPWGEGLGDGVISVKFGFISSTHPTRALTYKKKRPHHNPTIKLYCVFCVKKTGGG